MNRNESKPNVRTGTNHLVLLIGLATLLAGYALLRYGGWWGEADTNTFTRIIASNLDQAKLVPKGNVYSNGYGYQALVLFVIEVTGISLAGFQLYISIMLAAWVVVPAWLAYRELTQSDLAASLASLILLVQPEFLFPLLRGTHEKFTRGLMFIGLYLLLRSLRSRSTRLTGVLTLCFYLCAYALISFNTFMASSFILTILLALGLVWLIGRWAIEIRATGLPVVNKLFYVTISLLVIAIIFTFYAYAPAQDQLRVLESIWDRLALLFLQVEDSTNNPYQVVNAGWVSLPVYFLVSLANWLLLGVSLILWVKQTCDWLVKRSTLPARHELMLWALYAASAMIGFSSVLIDVSGSLSTNMQHRIFPSFVMIAAPLAGAWLARLKPTGSHRQKLIWTGATLTLGGLMVLSVFKATNEPLLSNYWMFYTPTEKQAVVWAEKFLSRRSLWTGPGDGLTNGYTILENGRRLDVELDAYNLQSTTHNYLISDVTRLYIRRLGRLLPIQADALLTYDNGRAQIYHRRPVTPFQK